MSISVSIVRSRVDGIVPLAVLFDATGTTSTATSRPFHDCYYVWDFGDTGSGNHPTITGMPTRSRNTAYGPVAAHVYENSGTYTVTLTVYDSDGTVDTATTTITATDWEEGVTGDTVVVAEDGDFTGAPSHDVEVDPSVAGLDFDGIINQYIATHKRILFKRGELYTANAKSSIDVTGPGIIGAWGSGAKPAITSSLDGICIGLSSLATKNLTDWRIMDLSIDCSSGTASSCIDAEGEMSQLLVYRVDMANAHFFVRVNASILDETVDTMFDQIAVVDCTGTTGVGGQTGNGLFLWGSKLTVMGNVINPAGGVEHGTRIMYSTPGVISRNVFTGGATSKTDFTFRAPDFAGGETLPAGSYNEYTVISENKFISAFTSSTAVTGPNNSGTGERIKDCIWENNWMIGSTVTTTLFGNQAYNDITVRNNLFDLTNYPAFSRGVRINVTDAHDPENMHYYNNTFSATAGNSNMWVMDFNGGTGHRAYNNVAYIQDDTSAVMFQGVSGLNEDYATVNSTTTQVRETNPGVWSSYAVATDFQLQSDAPYAIASGDNTPVLFDDFFRTARDRANLDMGFHAYTTGTLPSIAATRKGSIGGL